MGISDSQKKTLQLISKLSARLRDLENAKIQPVAVVGLACRFPGARPIAKSFWQLLEQGGDAIREVPHDRWNIDAYYDPDPEAPGKMYDSLGRLCGGQVDQFDPSTVRHLAPREVVSMDPQHRLLLEVSLGSAGSTPASGPVSESVGQSSTGVFMGISAPATTLSCLAPQ